MLGDYAEPRGNAGYSVDHDVAMKIATHMREIMAYDLDETDVATFVQIYNFELDTEEFIAAWELLNAGERAAWRRFVNYEEWLRNEKLRDAH